MGRIHSTSTERTGSVPNVRNKIKPPTFEAVFTVRFTELETLDLTNGSSPLILERTFTENFTMILTHLRSNLRLRGTFLAT